MKKSILFASVVLSLGVSATFAQQASPFYGTASVGSTQGNLSSSEINDGLTASRYTSPSTSIKNTDSAFRIGAGYRFAPAFALEGYYVDLGKYSSSSTAANLAGFRGTADANYKSNGFGVDAVFTAPLANGFSIYGRAGLVRASTEGRFTSDGNIVRLTSAGAKVNTTAHTFGVGAQYDFTPQFGLRLEVQRYYKLGNGDTGGELKVNVYSLGGVLNF
jgi:OmpA-OmpF porin, OOP family